MGVFKKKEIIEPYMELGSYKIATYNVNNINNFKNMYNLLLYAHNQHSISFENYSTIKNMDAQEKKRLFHDLIEILDKATYEIKERRTPRTIDNYTVPTWYLGRDSQDGNLCKEDAIILMSRVVMDNSSHGGRSDIYLNHQLRNSAYDIGKKNPNNSNMDNWSIAQFDYVRSGLRDLDKIVAEDMWHRQK